MDNHEISRRDDTTGCIVDKETTESSNTTTNSKKACGKPLWKRLNHKGVYHDNRRLLKHRAKNCECFVCYREIYKLPPAETHDEYVAGLKTRKEEREIKLAKRIIKKDIKAGRQSTITFFYKDLSGEKTVQKMKGSYMK
jgi:hypothetical protein